MKNQGLATLRQRLRQSEKGVIAIAGTDQGADTAIVVKPAYSTDFFNLKIKEIVVMPG